MMFSEILDWLFIVALFGLFAVLLKPFAALLSFLFLCTSKPIIGYFYRRQMKKSASPHWRCLSQHTINQPWVLPYMMSHGPRLNPHAIIGLMGPIPVSRQLHISRQDMQDSATDWTVVVYALPGLATVASAGASSEASQITEQKPAEETAGEILLELPPGHYLLGMRYYHWKEEVLLPAVMADNQVISHTQSQSAKALNAFHYRFGENHQWLYKALNYYVYWLLKYRQWLPHSFVDKQYLPVGNPNTVFKYHKIEKGEVLNLKVDLEARAETNAGESMEVSHNRYAQDVLKQGDIFYCIYNQASLPTTFGQLTGASLQVVSPIRGTVLIRLCCHQKQQASQWANQLSIQVGKLTL